MRFEYHDVVHNLHLQLSMLKRDGFCLSCGGDLVTLNVRFPLSRLNRANISCCTASRSKQSPNACDYITLQPPTDGIQVMHKTLQNVAASAENHDLLGFSVSLSLDISQISDSPCIVMGTHQSGHYQTSSNNASALSPNLDQTWHTLKRITKAIYLRRDHTQYDTNLYGRRPDTRVLYTYRDHQ